MYFKKKQREKNKECTLTIGGEQMQIGEFVDNCSKCGPQIDIALEFLGAVLDNTEAEGCDLTAICPNNFLLQNGRCVYFLHTIFYF